MLDSEPPNERHRARWGYRRDDLFELPELCFFEALLDLSRALGENLEFLDLLANLLSVPCNGDCRELVLQSLPLHVLHLLDVVGIG